MTAPKGHKVIVVPRGDGYASRCEVERDGVTHICDITFGGFRTKTEARAALAHEEAPVPAATGNEGEDQTNRQKEDQIVSTIIADAGVERQGVHPDVQATYERLEGVPSNRMLVLDESDPLFQRIPDVKRRTKSVFPTFDPLNPDTLDIGSAHAFWTIIGPDGRGVVDGFPDGFVEWAKTLPIEYFHRPNAAVRFGDFIAVSNGYFEVVGFEHAEDGSTVFELCTLKEAKRRRVAHIFEAHPEIQAMKPAWADQIDIDGTDDEFDVIYGREVGAVSVSQFALWDGEELVLEADGPNVNVDRIEGTVTTEYLRSVAADMVTVAGILDEAVTA